MKSFYLVFVKKISKRTTKSKRQCNGEPYRRCHNIGLMHLVSYPKFVFISKKTKKLLPSPQSSLLAAHPLIFLEEEKCTQNKYSQQKRFLLWTKVTFLVGISQGNRILFSRLHLA